MAPKTAGGVLKYPGEGDDRNEGSAPNHATCTSGIREEDYHFSWNVVGKY